MPIGCPTATGASCRPLHRHPELCLEPRLLRPSDRGPSSDRRHREPRDALREHHSASSPSELLDRPRDTKRAPQAVRSRHRELGRSSSASSRSCSSRGWSWTPSAPWTRARRGPRFRIARAANGRVGGQRSSGSGRFWTPLADPSRGSSQIAEVARRSTVADAPSVERSRHSPRWRLDRLPARLPRRSAAARAILTSSRSPLVSPHSHRRRRIALLDRDSLRSRPSTGGSTMRALHPTLHSSLPRSSPERARD